MLSPSRPTRPQQQLQANFAAGGTASLITQSVIVPVDVVSQRIMVSGKTHCCPPCMYL